jgi:ubiquinone/menaquinone biosynthesis C-methylase UbiE
LSKIQEPIYDKFARRYDCAFSPLERLGLTRWRKETLALLPQDSRILELGCGTGLNFAHYPKCKIACATEFSFEMISRAREKAGTILLALANAESLPFADDSFDAAFATLVFCSIANSENAFRELRRVVLPKGKIILLEHVRPAGALGKAFDTLSKFTEKYFEDHFNRETAKTAAASGLNVLEVRKKLGGTVNLIICENQKG